MSVKNSRQTLVPILRRASILGLGAAVALGFGCEKKLDTDQRKASYAIGQQIGQIKLIGYDKRTERQVPGHFSTTNAIYCLIKQLCYEKKKIVCF